MLFFFRGFVENHFPINYHQSRTIRMWICKIFCVFSFCWFRLKSIPKLNTVKFLWKDLVSDKFHFFSSFVSQFGKHPIYEEYIAGSISQIYFTHKHSRQHNKLSQKGNAFSAIKMLIVTIQRTSGSKSIDDENSLKDKILCYHQFQYQILWNHPNQTVLWCKTRERTK